MQPVEPRNPPVVPVYVHAAAAGSSTSSQNPAPRHRNGARTAYTRFSEAEHEMLLAGVRHFGAGKWKTILRNYPFHAKRTTVDLKDKYRNILRAREREKRQPLQQASVENRVNPQVAADNPSLVQHHQLRQQGLLQTQQHVEEKSVALATNLLPPVTVVENHSPLPPCPSMVHTVSNPSGHFLPSLSNGLSDESYCHVQRNEPTGEPRYEYHNYALIYKQPPSSQSYAPGGESQLSGSRKIPAPERMKLTTLLCDPDTEY